MNSAVLGMLFGDEGKGVVVDYLCSQRSDSAVLRFSGGHQAAHTVNYNGTEHVFTNFGSGTLRGCETYWSEFCTFEPRGFWNEFKILKSKGVSPIIHIHSKCRVTTPYDIIANWLSPERANGTCGVGVWKTVERDRAGVTFNAIELFTMSERDIKARLFEIGLYYNELDHPELPYMIDQFRHSARCIKENASGGFRLFIDYPKSDNLIFEGSQGILLDQDIGFNPHTTPSKTNMWNLLQLGYFPDDVFLVTRAYQTRHGAGPMTNEDKPFIFEQFEEATQNDEFRGELRKTMLDLDLLKRSVTLGVNSACWHHGIRKNLVITCLDQMDEYYLTEGGKVIKFDKPELFIYHIGMALRIDGEMYGNYSPRSDTIKELGVAIMKK